MALHKLSLQLFASSVCLLTLIPSTVAYSATFENELENELEKPRLICDATAAKAGSTPKAEPTFKSEKPMLDSSTPKVDPPPAQQSPSGYFIPPEVTTSGAPNGASNGYPNGSPNGAPTNYQQSAPPNGGYGGQPGYGAPSYPMAPPEAAIPEFGKPLPSLPNQAMGNPSFGPGWGPGPSSGPGPSNDDVRVGRLEKSVLGTTYPEHDLIDRVEHLEEEVFKAKSSGPMDERLKKMETAVFGQSAAFGGQPSPGGSQMPQAQRPPVASAPPPMSPQQPPQQQANRAPYEMAPYPAQAPSQPNNYGAPSGMPAPGAPNGMPPQGAYGAPPAYGAPYQANQPNLGQPGGYPNQYSAPPGQAPSYPSQAPTGYPPYGNAPQGGRYPSQGQPGYGQPPYNAGAPGYGANPPVMGTAPYAPPSQIPYGTPQPYGGRPPIAHPVNAAPPGQYRPVTPTQPVQYAIDPESQRVAAQITADASAGDYFAAVRKFQNSTVARWKHFPVLVHLPASTPDNWHKSLLEDVKKWSSFVPLKTAADYESFVIDVKWENKLPPRVLGITRVEGSGAGLKVVIFLLRPTFYPPDVPETTLQAVFLHELGHGIGLFGHSSDVNDVMYYDEKTIKKAAQKVNTISARDLNTLKKVYSAAPIADSFVIQPPLEYSLEETDL